MKFLKTTALFATLLVSLALSISLLACDGGENGDDTHTHSFGAWQTVTEPTCAIEGLKKQTCSCGAEKTENIDKLTTHTFENGDCKVCGYLCPHLNLDGANCADCRAGAVTYTVALKDAENAPISAFVYIYRGGEQKAFKITDAAGVASFTLMAGIHTFSVAPMSETKYAIDDSKFVLTPDAPNAEVTLYSDFLGQTEIYCSFETEGQLYAKLIANGGDYNVAYNNSEMSYFVFTPEETGVYQITFVASDDVGVGYYGGPYFVLGMDVTQEKNRINTYTILIDVAPANIAGENREASNYVIGTTSVSASGFGVLSVERVSDHELTPDDLPFTPYGETLSPEFFCPENSNLPGFTLTELDVTNPDLKIVYNEADGYYHHMTIDGPIVLVKLDVATKYLDSSFAKMCETQAFNCYIYNEDGSFNEKVTYHAMLLKYIAACATKDGGVGAYPLDEHLMKAIIDVGTFRGWYNLDSTKNTQIFGDDKNLVVAENAWMFALCYAEIKPVDHNVTVKNENGEPLAGVTVSITDDEGFVLTTAVTDSKGVATLNFKHLADCFVKFDESITQDYTLPAGDIKLEGVALEITLTAVVQDGGDSIIEYDPEKKYALYNWDNTNIKVQINEYSGFGEFSSNYKRCLAGETTNTAEYDKLILARNTAAIENTKTSVTYLYKTDTDTPYAWGSAGSKISQLVFSSSANVPDIFIDSTYDLVAASLSGCFFNIQRKTEDNNFSFIELGYDPDKNAYGYLGDLMDSFSFSPAKRYILASDYLPDTVRAMNIIPVNVSLLESLAPGVLGNDMNENGKTDISDFHNTVTDGKWDYELLMQLSSLMVTSDSEKKGFVLDTSSERVASAILYSSDTEIFTREENKDDTAYSLVYNSSADDFSLLANSLSMLSEHHGISTVDAGFESVRARFISHGVLLGGIIPLGALENDDYKAISAEGIYIAPLPMTETAKSYKTVLDSTSRLAAVNVHTESTAQATAFLDYQSTHSTQILDAYCLYGLLWGAVGATEENKEALKLLRESLTPSYASVYDAAIEGYFKLTNEATHGKSWTSILTGSDYKISTPSEIFSSNTQKRLKYIEKIIEDVSDFN